MQHRAHGSSIVGTEGDPIMGLPTESRVSAPISNERKYATILVADLQQSTQLVAELDPEEAIERLEPALTIMREAVYRHGGIVSRELGDGVKALFGAPRSDDKHAAKACHAGIEIVNRIAQLNDSAIQVRVGIHSDYVVTRITRNDYSSVYDATGPAAHLADRLQSAAPAGNVLVSTSCQALCEGLIVFETLPSKNLKGFSQPVPVFRVTGLSTLSRWRTRSQHNIVKLVGRSLETTRLRHSAAAVGPGSGQVVVLAGDSGIGKSRVAHEFLNGLSREEWQIIEVECSPTKDAIPYAAIRDLLLSVYPQLRGTDIAIRQWVQSNQFEIPEFWDSALATVLDRPLSNQKWHDLARAQRQRCIADTFCAFIGHLAVLQRVAILIEDLHWADSASSIAFEALAVFAGQHQFLMLTTSRPHSAPRWPNARNVTRIELRPLDVESGHQLLNELLGPSAQLADLRSHVLRHTGGVPLFVEEVVRHLVDSGKLVGSWGNFDWPASSKELGVPPTVQGAIAERIDRLGANEKKTLLSASVVGPRVAQSLLPAVVELPQALLCACLNSLDAAGLLLDCSVNATREYEFAHDLVREVAYGMLLTRDRERLHGAILAALEGGLHADSDAVETLSHHALKARDWPKAAIYARLSAQRCLSRSALHESSEYFKLAADTTDRLPYSVQREEQAIDLRLEARHAFPATGNFAIWMQFSSEAVERSRALGDVSREVAALVAEAAAANFHGSLRKAIESSEAAVRRAELWGVPGWLSLAEYGLGQALLTAGWSRPATLYLGRAIKRLAISGVETPRGTSAPHLSVLCCMMKGIAHAAMGEQGFAKALLRRASAIATVSGRPYDLIAVDYGRGYYLFRWNQYGRAHTALRRALDISERHAIRQFVPVISCLLGKLYLEENRLSEARDALICARMEADRVGHTLASLRSSAYLATVQAKLGNAAEALVLAGSAKDIAANEGFESVTVEALLSEVTALTVTCGSAMLPAEQRLEEAMAIADRIEAKPLLASAKALLGHLRLQRGETTLAVGNLEEAAALYTQMRMSKQLKPIKLAIQQSAEA